MTPTKLNYNELVSKINASKVLVGASIYERGRHVTIPNTGHKLKTEALLKQLK